jgi:hypothetical protein
MRDLLYASNKLLKAVIAGHRPAISLIQAMSVNNRVVTAAIHVVGDPGSASSLRYDLTGMTGLF